MIQPIYQAAANQFIATSDAWILRPGEPNRPQELWGLSVIGPQTSVKAIAAAILKASPDTVAITPAGPGAAGPAQYAVRAPESGKWRAKTARLKMSRAWHGIIYPVMAEYEPQEAENNDFLLLTRDGSALGAADKHARFLNRRTDVPIHPSWADWLWARARQTGEAQRLTTPRNFQAWLCSPDETALKNDLSRAVAAGELTA